MPINGNRARATANAGDAHVEPSWAVDRDRRKNCTSEATPLEKL
jgi:hypothetical protein